jgi:hypothetical protein
MIIIKKITAKTTEKKWCLKWGKRESQLEIKKDYHNILNMQFDTLRNNNSITCMKKFRNKKTHIKLYTIEHATGKKRYVALETKHKYGDHAS